MNWKKILVRTLIVIGVLYIGLVIYRVPAIAEKQKTEKTVAAIHAQKLTMDMVTGKNLPPPPDPKLVDATLEGVDANNNGIRDDVELAIFKKYPNSARIRAAELQYAMALQMELTKVFNTETLVAAAQQDSRGSLCISSTAPNVNLTDSEEVIKNSLAIADMRTKEVENLVLNTLLRKEKYQDIYKKYMTSFGDLDGQNCDINF